MSKPSGDKPQRRGPGRPRRTPEERAAAKERRIPISRDGRLLFKPGLPHALDVQMSEAANYRVLITEKLTQLQRLLAELDMQDADPSVAISAQEAALQEFLWSTYRHHKHRDHIVATFLAIRRERLLAKIEAAGAALAMAAELLAPDDRLLQELQAAVAHQRQAAARQRSDPAKQPSEREEPAQAQGGQSGQVALIHIFGESEQDIRDQFDAIRAERERQDDLTQRINHRHIYGDVNTTRRQLDEFHAQVKRIRAAISPAIGWFEEYYVEKVRLTVAGRQCIMDGRELSEDEAMFEGIMYGPYLKYRWQELTGGPQYTIQMGLLPASSQDQEDSEGEPSGDPWPQL